MFWLLSLFIFLLLFAVLGWYSRRLAILTLLALLPTYLLRMQIAGIPTTWFELALYIVFIIALLRGELRFLNLEFLNRWWRVLLPVGFLLVAAILGVIVSPHIRLALGILKGWIFDPLLLSVLFISLFIKIENKEAAKILWRDVLMFLMLGAVVTVLFAMSLDYLGQASRLKGWYDSPNVMAMYLVPITLASTLWFFSKIGFSTLSSRLKIFWAASSILLLIGVILTWSFAGWLSLVVAYAVCYSLKIFSWKKLAVSIGLIFILAGFVFPWIGVSNPNLIGGHFNSAYKIGSGEIRSILWREAKAMILQHPVLGIGLGQWQSKFQPLISPALRGVHNPGYLVELYYASLFPHNLWLNTWLSLGLLGVIALGWLVLLVFKNNKTQQDFIYFIPVGVLSTILIQGMVDTPVYKNDLAVIFWLAFFAATIIGNDFYKTEIIVKS
jgi:O-antigen ligase